MHHLCVNENGKEEPMDLVCWVIMLMSLLMTIGIFGMIVSSNPFFDSLALFGFIELLIVGFIGSFTC